MRSQTPLTDEAEYDNGIIDRDGALGMCVDSSLSRKIEIRMRRAERQVRAVKRAMEEWGPFHRGRILAVIAAAGRRAGA